MFSSKTKLVDEMVHRDTMKKIVFCLLLVINVIAASSQTEMQISQYMFQHPVINPAAVGESGMIQVSGLHHLQWVGVRNAGNTTLFSVNTPLKFSEKSLHGAGLKFRNDVAGQYYFQNAHLQYAYKKKISQGTFSAGIDIGFVNVGFRGDSVNLSEIPFGDYHASTSEDLFIPSTDVSGMGFDMSVGVWYSSPKFYVGAAYLNLTQPNLYWTDQREYKLKSVFNFTGGYNWRFEDPKFLLKPSVLLKTDFVSMQVDVSANLEYDNKYWGGLAYRLQDAVVILAGIRTPIGLNLGYSFDIPTSKIGGWGSHELSLVYEFEYVFEKHKNKYKSIRIL